MSLFLDYAAVALVKNISKFQHEIISFNTKDIMVQDTFCLLFEAFIPDNFHIYMQYKTKLSTVKRVNILQLDEGRSWYPGYNPETFDLQMFDIHAPLAGVINLVFEVSTNSTLGLMAAIDNLRIANGTCLNQGKMDISLCLCLPELLISPINEEFGFL